jgi:hypothetical protein
MDEATRGSSLAGLLSYLEKSCDDARFREVQAALSPELRRDLAGVKHAAWYPRRHFIELNEAIASLHEGNETATRDALEAAGREISYIASNTFMRLLLKMLTPAQFAKKFPDFWNRDMRGGRCSADTRDLASRRLYAGLHDVAGFTHVGPVAAGYIGFAMDAITGTRCTAQIEGWSLASPASSDIHYVVTW